MSDRAIMTTTGGVSMYTLLHDTYYGTGLFKDGNGLIQHPRESVRNYQNRKTLAFYLNYTGPIVDSSTDPVFRNEINRDYKDTLLFQSFLMDVDRTGTTLQEFMKKTAKMAKLYGVVYVIVDNEPLTGESVEDAVKYRRLPFLSVVLPQNITAWELSPQGHLTRLSYKAEYTDSLGGKGYTEWTWTPTEWNVSGIEAKGGNKRGVNPLGYIPVVQWFGRATDSKTIKPPPEFLSVAQTNYFLYQLCSWHTQIMRDQAFSILTMPDNGQDDITVGTNNVLTYPPEANHTPSFISPDATPANMLTDQIDRLIKEIYRMSGINSVVGVESTKSGVAKQWDFEKTNQQLADFAGQCELAEKRIVALYEAWTNEAVEYSCEYPRDFSINDVTDILAQAQQAKDLGYNSPSFDAEVMKKVLQGYLPNIAPETYDAIIEEIEKDAAAKVQSTAFGNNLTPNEGGEA